MNQIVEQALKWEGKEFHPGVSAQCAEWVSTILDAAGVKGEGYRHTAWCPDFALMGEYVRTMSELLPGDLVLFDNTYMDATFTHVGIYLGNGEMIHRNTMEAPVQKAYIKSDYWMSRFNQGRRFSVGTQEEDVLLIEEWYNKNGRTLKIHGDMKAGLYDFIDETRVTRLKKKV